MCAKVLLSSLVALGVAAFGGCALTGPSVKIPAEDPLAAYTPLPKYFEGDVYAYEEQVQGKTSRYTVDSSSSRRVKWRVGKDFFFETSPSQVLPWLSLETSAVEVKRDLVEGELFPLRPGQDGRKLILTTQIKQAGKTSLDYRDQFDCEVGGWEQVTVKAGSYRALPIQCTHWIAGAFGSGEYVNARVGKSITWFAPEAGQYVRRLEMDRNFRVTKDWQLTEHRISLSRLSAEQQQTLSEELKRFAVLKDQQGATRQWNYSAEKMTVVAVKLAPDSAATNACQRYRLDVSRDGFFHSVERQYCPS